LEAKVENAVASGAEGFGQLEPITVYQWAGKIFFGLLYRELTLAFDRSDPSFSGITTPEFLEGYQVLHGFLQSIRTAVQFEGFFPGSIFSFSLENFPELDVFDFSDSYDTMTLSLRMGDIGLVVCLKDNNVIAQDLSEIYEALKGHRLHPIQYDEFTALVFYRAFSLQRRATFVSATGRDEVPRIFSVPGWSLTPYFSDWKPELYARFLEEFWSKYGLELKDIFVPPDQVRTYLGEYL
jgi:hypothetical protein